jgi:hypothetical protein
MWTIQRWAPSAKDENFLTTAQHDQLHRTGNWNIPAPGQATLAAFIPLIIFDPLTIDFVWHVAAAQSEKHAKLIRNARRLSDPWFEKTVEGGSV